MRIAIIWLEMTGTLLSFIACQKGRSDIHHDENVDTHGAGNIHRKVLAYPTVTSSRPSRSTGAKTPGADMLARMALVRSPEVDRDGLAGLEVGGRGPERRRQLIEVRDPGHGQGEASQDLVEPLPLDESLGQQKLAAANP